MIRTTNSTEQHISNSGKKYPNCKYLFYSQPFIEALLKYPQFISYVLELPVLWTANCSSWKESLQAINLRVLVWLFASLTRHILQIFIAAGQNMSFIKERDKYVIYLPREQTRMSGIGNIVFPERPAGLLLATVVYRMPQSYSSYVALYERGKFFVPSLAIFLYFNMPGIISYQIFPQPDEPRTRLVFVFTSCWPLFVD